MLDIIITVISITIIICIWVILYDSNRFVISKYSFQDSRICQKTRIVVLADLHNKRYGKENERLVEAIRACQPDLIMVAGDIPTAKPGEKLDVAIHLLEKLVGEYPVYYGNGNHEHRMKLYQETYGDMAERYEEALKRLKVNLLVNAHVKLAERGITIYGAEIDKLYYKRFKIQHMDSDYVKSILGQADSDTYHILLAHNPDYFPQYAAWGADLVLAGHVHGGMVRIPFLKKGVISPALRLFPKYDGGLFRQDKSVMLLSRGLGMHTIPIRLFNPGELLVVDLEGIDEKIQNIKSENH